ncbi:MAG: hypothetical protein LV480_14820 [Methylacidiphilales bacterium]|nr:hypothetical protein [Candidatus Methylacidiphilales bacterium]
MVKKPVVPLVLFACSMALAACDTTPPAVSTLMKQVADACQAHDPEVMQACYAHEGVTQDQIDQQLGSWDEYLAKGDQSDHWSYSGITYVSLADAPNNKSILPEAIAAAKGTTISGIKFAPNIKVLGFILVSFKQPDGTQAGQTEDVGIASDGTAKIALVEPR